MSIEVIKAAEAHGTKIWFKGEKREWKQKLVGDKMQSFLAGVQYASSYKKLHWTIRLIKTIKQFFKL